MKAEATSKECRGSREEQDSEPGQKPRAEGVSRRAILIPDTTCPRGTQAFSALQCVQSGNHPEGPCHCRGNIHSRQYLAACGCQNKATISLSLSIVALTF